MAHWLLKSEPRTYSIDDLERDGECHWEGVRNAMATRNLKAMAVGDRAFFYHSSANPPGVAGICEVIREAYPDHTAFDPDSPYHDPRSTPEEPRWFMPDVKFIAKLPRLVPLREIKSSPGLEDMSLVRISRLSVHPVTDEQWRIICGLAGAEA